MGHEQSLSLNYSYKNDTQVRLLILLNWQYLYQIWKVNMGYIPKINNKLK